MKKIISTLLILVAFASAGIAQEANEIATSKGEKALTESKSSGKYVFTLPSELTSETVEKNASYYTATFDVNFDQSSHVAKITMNSNELKDRYVVVRFLTACNVSYVQVGEETMKLYDFVEKYIK